MTNHESTIENHIRANFAAAIDQQDAYTDPNWTVWDAYSQNTVESVLDDGYTADEAFAAGNTFLAMAHAAGF